MMHSTCGTYNEGRRRCEDCGKYWCERCRVWFTASSPVKLNTVRGEGARATHWPTLEENEAEDEAAGRIDEAEIARRRAQMRHAPRIEDLLEASSLGTPQAKATRAEGRQLLKGVLPKVDKRLARIEDDFTAGLFDEREAYERCLEAGCTPEGARMRVARWAGSAG